MPCIGLRKHRQRGWTVVSDSKGASMVKSGFHPSPAVFHVAGGVTALDSFPPPPQWWIDAFFAQSDAISARVGTAAYTGG